MSGRRFCVPERGFAESSDAKGQERYIEGKIGSSAGVLSLFCCPKSNQKSPACQKQRNPRRSLATPEGLPFSLVLSLGQAKESTDARFGTTFQSILPSLRK